MACSIATCSRRSSRACATRAPSRGWCASAARRTSRSSATTARGSSGSGVAVGLQSKGTALIHRADLEPLDNLELFGMAPSLTLDSYRQIGRNAAGYALGRPVAPVPTVMDNYARAKLIVRTTCCTRGSQRRSSAAAHRSSSSSSQRVSDLALSLTASKRLDLPSCLLRRPRTEVGAERTGRRRSSRCRSRASTDSGVSWYSVAAIVADPRRSAMPVTTTVQLDLAAADVDLSPARDLLRRLHAVAAHLDVPTENGLGRGGAGLEEPRRPEPLVDPNALHPAIFAVVGWTGSRCRGTICCVAYSWP